MSKTAEATAQTIAIIEKFSDIILNLLAKVDAGEQDKLEAQAKIAELTTSDEVNAALVETENTKLLALLEAATAAVIPHSLDETEEGLM